MSHVTIRLPQMLPKLAGFKQYTEPVDAIPVPEPSIYVLNIGLVLIPLLATIVESRQGLTMQISLV
jgi:hypothetical protein